MGTKDLSGRRQVQESSLEVNATANCQGMLDIEVGQISSP